MPSTRMERKWTRHWLGRSHWLPLSHPHHPSKQLFQAQLSRSLVTTKALLKAGGKEEAATLPQTRSSSWYTMKASEQASNSTPDISQARTTLPMTHPVESTSPETSYHPSPSHMHTNSWLSTLMKNLAQASCTRSMTEQLQSQVQNPTEKHNSMQERSSTTPLNVRLRSSLHKRKAGSDTIHHPTALPLPPQRNTRPAPYSDNLHPLPSMLHPHVLA